jgi:hypothetical protein
MLYYLCEVLENKISIMSLINDLGINEVPKEIKNQEIILSKFLEIIILNYRISL